MGICIFHTCRYVNCEWRKEKGRETDNIETWQHKQTLSILAHGRIPELENATLVPVLSVQGQGPAKKSLRQLFYS